MTLQLSTRSGTPLSSPRASFTNIELANNQYLQWNGAFENRLAGLKGHDEKIEARFFIPSGLQIPRAQRADFCRTGEKTADFSGVALMPDSARSRRAPTRSGSTRRPADRRAGVHRQPGPRALKVAEAANEAGRRARRRTRPRRTTRPSALAMLEVRRRKPLQFADIEFLNSTKSGTPLAGRADLQRVQGAVRQLAHNLRESAVQPRHRSSTGLTPRISHPTATPWAASTTSASCRPPAQSAPSAGGSATRPAAHFCRAVHGQFLSQRAIYARRNSRSGRRLRSPTRHPARQRIGARSSGGSTGAARMLPTLATGLSTGCAGGTNSRWSCGCARSPTASCTVRW